MSGRLTAWRAARSLAAALFATACASGAAPRAAESGDASLTFPSKSPVEAIAFAPGAPRASIAFLYAPGDRAVVLRAEGAGEWKQVGLLDRAGQVYDAIFDDARTGVLLHGALDRAVIYRTIDGGASWSEIARLTGRYVRLLRDLEGALLILGSGADGLGSVLRSADGADPKPFATFDGDPPILVSDLARSGGRTFLVGGGTGRGALFASDDGRRFRRVDVGDVPNLLSIAFDSRGAGLAVGARGEALRTVDGGATWKPTLSGTDRGLASVLFVSDGHALACGEEGVLLATRDAGATFHAVEIGRRDDFFRLVPSADGAYVLGARGTAPFLRVP